MAILAQKSGQKTVREWAFTYYISALGIWPKTPILGVKIPHFWTKNGSFFDPFFGHLEKGPKNPVFWGFEMAQNYGDSM